MPRTPPGRQLRAWIAAFILVSGALALAPGAAAQGSELKPAPAYAATTLDGETMTLEGLRGGVVMLNVWATWCTPCIEEMPRLQALQEKYAASGLTVIGASVDERGSEESVRATVEKLGVRYAIWLDPEDRATSAFRLIGLPATILVTADGRVAHEWKGQFDPLSNETFAIVDAALQGEAAQTEGGIGGLGLAVAFAAGALSFLSPCVFPLVPSYVAVISGMSMDELTATGKTRRHVRRHVIVNGLVFVAGFSTVFLGLGASATMLGGLLSDHRAWLAGIGGALLVAFGLVLLGVLRIPGADREFRVQVAQRPGLRRAGVFLVGLAFGAGWTPCIGPVLAGILTLAASTASLAEGLRLLAAYSLGLAVPFLAAALALRRLLPAMGRLGRWLPVLHKASGVLLVAVGILLLTGGMALLSTWLARAAPDVLRGLG